MTVRWLVLGLALASCISNPTPHPGADTGVGGTDLSDTSNKVDDDSDLAAPADAVQDSSAEPDIAVETDVDETDVVEPDIAVETDVADPGTPFPPEGVLLRDVVVLDLDHDGFDDVLLTDIGAASRVWVMFGDAARTGLDLYDHAIDTQCRPQQVLATNLTGAAGGFEISVLGATAEAASGWLEIHPFDGHGFTAPLKRQTSAPNFEFVPRGGTAEAGQPVVMASLDVTGDGQSDLVLGDLYRLYALHPTSWTAGGFGATDHTYLAADPTWYAILQIFPIEHEAARWLAVFQQDMAVRYFPVGVSGIDLDAEVTVDLNDQQGIRNAVLTDFDRDGQTDITTVFGNTVSVIRFTPPTAEIFDSARIQGVSDDSFEDSAVGDVDASGDNDIVLLDRAPVGQQSTLWLLRDPRLDGGSLTLLSDYEKLTLPIGRAPSHLAVGRFGSDGVAIWTFDGDGTPRCYRWDGGAEALRACP